MTRIRLNRLLSAALLGLALSAGAADTTPPSAPQPDDFAIGRKAIEAKDWKLAADSFARVVAKDGRNADAYNLLGYSLRWQGKLDEALAAYGKALAVNPDHRGALHYSGIAYLKTGQKAQAEANLARLQKSCAACDETAQLAKAIAEAGAVTR